MQRMRTVENLPLFLERGIPNTEAHQKPVELGLWKRERPVIFGGILRGNDHKGLLKWMRLIIDGNLCFTHRFQEAALGLRRGAIDLIGQHDVGEDRTRYELKSLFLPVKHGDADDVGRQEIARELNALERTVKRSGQAVRQRGFADARNIFEQKMATGQKADHRHLDDMGFSLDDERNIVLDRPDGVS